MHDGPDARPDRATVLRYAALQIPGYVFGGLLAFGAIEWLGVEPLWAVAAGIAWLVKDVAMFPFVWRAYATRSSGGPHDIRGRTGRVEEALDPEGRVRVGPERWRAVASGGATLAPGTTVRVVAVDGLRLTVEPAAPGERGTSGPGTGPTL